MSRHVEDSLALLPVIEAHAAPTKGSETLRMIDVGSGGGLPGLLLAIARPEW
jgi:16S rRNA (guanine527-N7)-methyltransferase